jgi:hypothetical protein
MGLRDKVAIMEVSMELGSTKLILLVLFSVGAGGSTAGRMVNMIRVYIAHAHERYLGGEFFLPNE